MNLYQIDRAIEELLEASFNFTVDEETGEVTFEDRSAEIEELQIERAKKLEAVALYIKNLDALAEDIKAEEKALAERRKAKEKKAEYLRQYLGNSLTVANEPGFETAKVKVAFRKSEAVIVDEEKLDKAFIKETIKTAPDKTAIKKAIKAGQEVTGAYIEERKAVKIQ